MCKRIYWNVNEGTGPVASDIEEISVAPYWNANEIDQLKVRSIAEDTSSTMLECKLAFYPFYLFFYAISVASY
ncbi:hypothetical protein JQ038_05285 [Clostridium botulinum]|nr:hypothetical protein [Clostridium botulinum]MCS4472578.1 hypothetical protein [Clostridium botulinum]MCS4480932.1 hypothetical protein [Clostridium botulinum]MCS4482179.1 hypothetical protein [Clostridium botulinum]